jgi:hypothetical protein
MRLRLFFHSHRSRPVPLDSPIRKLWKQMGLSHEIDNEGSRRRSVFTIVSRRLVTAADGTPGRRVLIFDNHPATLRLLNTLEENDLLSHSRKSWRYAIVSILFLAVMLLGMVWLLLESTTPTAPAQVALPNGVPQITSAGSGINPTSAQ